MLFYFEISKFTVETACQVTMPHHSLQPIYSSLCSDWPQSSLQSEASRLPFRSRAIVGSSSKSSGCPEQNVPLCAHLIRRVPETAASYCAHLAVGALGKNIMAFMSPVPFRLKQHSIQSESLRMEACFLWFTINVTLIKLAATFGFIFLTLKREL